MKVKTKDVKDFVHERKICLVYFNGTSCGACEVIKVKLLEIVKKYENLEMLNINAENSDEFKIDYSIFSVPVGILYVEGKETIRFGKYIDLLDLESKIDRYYNMIF